MLIRIKRNFKMPKRIQCASLHAIEIWLALLLFSLNQINGAKHMTSNNNIGQMGQHFEREPEDQTAVVGSRVTFPCRVINKLGQLQWTKDDFGLGTHRNLSGFERYSMVGSDEEGDFSLDISPVMLDDDAKYQCQVGPGPQGQLGIRSRFATLTVLVPPEPPKIIQGDHLITTEDREIELECVSVGGKPAAEITWIDGHGTVFRHPEVEDFKEPLPDSRRFTARSILKLTPKQKHHNTTFTCQAQNTADRNYRTVKIKLEVKYAPKVSVNVIGGALAGGRIPEGAEVRLSCRANANPSEVTYRWFIGDELVIGDYTTEMIIPNVTRKYHDAIVKCEVHNAVGKSEETETLDISYGPVFRHRPKSVEADVGTTIQLSCDVDGNPTPEIFWIFEPSGRVIGTTPNITITVSEETAGRYFCKASVMGFPEIGAESTVHLKSRPIIKSPQRQYGTAGDNIRLECIAFSVPKARHVSWTYNGREINISNDQDYSILEDSLSDGIKSILIIRESQQHHFGRYNCTVVNDYGNDVLEIDLVAHKENFSLYVLFAGVGGASVFLVLLIVIYFWCCKTSTKKLSRADIIPEHHINEKGGSGCKESDRSSNLSDCKVDIRSDSCEPVYSETGSRTDSTTRIPQNSFGSLNKNGTNIYLQSIGKIPIDTRYSGNYADSAQLNTNNGNAPYIECANDFNGQSVGPFRSVFNKTPQHLLNGQLPTGNMSLPRNRNDLRQETGLTNIMLGSANSLQSGFTNQQIPQSNIIVDPQYNAAYCNPYLKSSNASLPPLPPPSTANPAATPAPPPYNATRTTVLNTNPLIVGGNGTNTGTISRTNTAIITPQTSSPSGHIILTANGNLKNSAYATHV